MPSWDLNDKCRLLLQTIVDAPCPELADALGFQEKRTKDLQETLQRVLDRREEERQSKELLQLYLNTVEKEDRQQEEPSQPSQEGMRMFLFTVYNGIYFLLYVNVPYFMSYV